MNESEPSKETKQQRAIRLLAAIKNSKTFLNFNATDNGWDDMFVLEELLKSECIAGFIIENGSGYPAQFLQARILQKGEQFLEELEMREQNRISMPVEIQTLKEKIKEMERVPHTLSSYWKLAGWGERFGMLGVFAGVFLFGYLCAKNSLASRIIELIRSMKP